FGDEIVMVAGGLIFFERVLLNRGNNLIFLQGIGGVDWSVGEKEGDGVGMSWKKIMRKERLKGKGFL
ncbi:hypothetical protein, partial [Bacillus sp. WP8]|uniref:hypothetical protein n=1 Tax=Bacillus sp. WP8 TaxID=756828 RepID=UPI001C92CC6C